VQIELNTPMECGLTLYKGAALTLAWQNDVIT